MLTPDVQQYIEGVPAETRPHFDQLHNLILQLYPEAKVVISYQIPTYKAKNGWVALGYWKGGASVYTNNPAFIEEFKRKNPRFKTGKASINLINGQPLPLEDLEQVIRLAVERT